jgi:hypothetical protein
VVYFSNATDAPVHFLQDKIMQFGLHEEESAKMLYALILFICISVFSLLWLLSKRLPDPKPA